ncbi:uncharacterized protein LOC114336833 isoform X3 [Diabrotica virgifera virgifera]|uniref:Uncharacterized protein LOC114336833 isoform X3 n=1 Tax=Diabrotica virgifera virgifera TaxID=50390 RepID=A0A6P7GDL3_DIAVI|nr:uncharacterized protein LOC114336833 isoform X3 [Diabrotica virgifera virgifera]
MKKLMLFVSVFVVVWADTDRDQKLKEELKKVKEHLNTCQHKFGKLPSYLSIKGFEQVKKKDEEYLGAIFLCYNTRLGLMSETGDLIEDRVRRFYTTLHGDSDRSKENIEKILKICKPPSHSLFTPEYKAFFFESCRDKHILIP